MDFGYFHEEESEQFAFYMIPQILFKDEKFAKLSTDAKVLYGLFLNRVSLSKKNHWINITDYSLSFSTTFVPFFLNTFSMIFHSSIVHYHPFYHKLFLHFSHFEQRLSIPHIQQLSRLLLINIFSTVLFQQYFTVS